MLHTINSIADWIIKLNPTINRPVVIDGSRMVHDQICRADLWKFRLAEAYITSIADYSTGTVDLTQGLATAAGTLTVWIPSHVESHFRVDGGAPDYPIQAVGGNTALTLAAPYVGDTVTGSAYTIRKKWYGLPWDFDKGEAIFDSDGLKLVNWRNLYQLEAEDPDASGQGSPDWVRIAPARNTVGYSTGTVTLTKNSTALTGSATVWAAARDQGRPVRFPMHPLAGVFCMKTVTDGTNAVLDRPWPFDTMSAQPHEIDPIGTPRIEFRPDMNSNTQIRLKYYRIMPPLYREDEFSPLPAHLHDIWLQATILFLSTTDPMEYQAKFATLMEPIRASDCPESRRVVTPSAWGIANYGGSNLPSNFPRSRTGRGF